MSWDRLQASYDHVAGLYEDRFVDELDDKPHDRALLDAFAAAVGDPVVELGCGPGQVGARVRAGGRRVVGLDLSGGMAALAAARLDGAVVGDLRALPLAPASVGGVVAFYSLIHLRRSELAPALAEAARVTRPGGGLLVAVHEGTGELTGDEFLGERVPFIASLFTAAELTAAVTTAGFTVVRAATRPAYPEERTVRLYLQARR
jgi:SAM-dependent methyltransferase